MQPDEKIEEELAALRAELAELRASVRARSRVELELIAPGHFLGQPAALRARVTDGEGREPRADVPVTFVTTWGRLRSTPGLPEGQTTLTVRTALDGTARVSLLSPLSDDIQSGQQASIEAMLQRLDREAATPREAESGLRALANAYEWGGSLNFRRGVDRYISELHPDLQEKLTRRNWMTSWTTVDSTVIAYVPPEAGPTNETGEMTATLSVRFIDWLMPWLQIYLIVLEERAGISTRFGEVTTSGGDTGFMIDGLYNRMQEFVRADRGKTGRFATEWVLDRGVRDFLSTGIESLPLATRGNIQKDLQLAANTVRAGGSGALLTLLDTRSQLSGQIDVLIAERPASGSPDLSGALGVFEGRIVDLETNMATKANSTTVQGELGSLRNDLTAGLARNDERADGLAGSLNGLSTLTSSLDGAFTELQSGLRATELRLGTAATAIGDLGTRLTSTESGITDLSGKVETNRLGAATFQTNVTRQLDAKADLSGVGDLSRSLSQAQGQLDELARTTGTTFTTLRSDVDRLGTNDATRATAITQLGTDFNTFRTDTTGRLAGFALKQDLVSLDDDTRGSIANLSAQLGTAETNLAALSASTATFDTRLSAAQGALGGLRTEVDASSALISSMQSTSTRLVSDVGVLTEGASRIDAATRDVVALQGEAARLLETTSAMSDSVSTLETKVGGLKTEVDDFRATTSTLEASVASVSGVASGLTTTADKLSGRIDTLGTTQTNFSNQTTSALNTKVSRTEFSQRSNAVNSQMAGKVSQTTYNQHRTANTLALSRKVETTDFNVYRTSTSQLIDSKADTTSLILLRSTVDDQLLTTKTSTTSTTLFTRS